MAEVGDASRLPARLNMLASDVRSKLDFHLSAYNDYVGINDAVRRVIEEKEKLQQDQNAVVQLVAEKDRMVAEKDKRIAELLAEKDELTKMNKELIGQVQGRELSDALLLQGNGFQHSQSEGDQPMAEKDQRIAELMAEREELTKRNQELKEQLQRRESTDGLAVHGNGVQTRSTHKRPRQSEGDDKGADEHELMDDQAGLDKPDQGVSTELEDSKRKISDIHSTLIKGFIDISSTGGRSIAIKYIGELNHKPFLPACLERLSHNEAPAKASELYYFWQEQILNPEWNPFKTVTVGGIPQEIIDVNDDKLQELNASWGEGVHTVVVNCLMEMKECGRLMDRTITPEVWNYKEKRKATLSESVEYMCNQVKRLNSAKSRSRR